MLSPGPKILQMSRVAFLKSGSSACSPWGETFAEGERLQSALRPILTSPSLTTIFLFGDGALRALPHRLLLSGPSLTNVSIEPCNDVPIDIAHWEKIEAAPICHSILLNPYRGAHPKCKSLHFRYARYCIPDNWLHYVLNVHPTYFSTLVCLKLFQVVDDTSHIESILQLSGPRLEDLHVEFHPVEPLLSRILNLSHNTRLETVHFAFDRAIEGGLSFSVPHNGLAAISETLATITSPVLRKVELRVDWDCPGDEHCEEDYPFSSLRSLDAAFAALKGRNPTLRGVALSIGFFHCNECRLRVRWRGIMSPCSIWDELISSTNPAATRERAFPFLGTCLPEDLRVRFGSFLSHFDFEQGWYFRANKWMR